MGLAVNWLLPKALALQGRVRTVGEPSMKLRQAARQLRYRIRRPRTSRAAYFREYNKTRRTYLAEKAREYRAQRKAA